MKLVMAIVQAADSRGLLDALMVEGFRATRISSTGGFLTRGNATFLIGAEEDRLEALFDLLRRHCHARSEFVSPVAPLSEAATARGWEQPLHVEVGSTVVFVMNVERFERI